MTETKSLNLNQKYFLLITRENYIFILFNIFKKHYYFEYTIRETINCTMINYYLGIAKGFGFFYDS